MLGFFFNNTAGAWGAKGHRVIGSIAEQHQTASTRAAIQEILGGEELAFAATWADEMRSSKDNPEFWGARYTANWHYVNIDAGFDYDSSDKNPRGDAYSALQTFIAILRDEAIPEGPVRAGLEFYFGDLDSRPVEVKRFALKFLLHLVGDLQQPLHSGFAEDQGGNQMRVQWFGEDSNLHTLWDTQLVEQQGLSYSELSAKLSGQIARMPAAVIRDIESAAPLAWIDEALVLRERIYAKNGDGLELGYDYAFEFTPVTEAQLIKGGLRLAWLLNQIFDR